MAFAGRSQGWNKTLVRTGTLASLAVTAHVAINLRTALTPKRPHEKFNERVSVLIPARNEAHRIGPTLKALLAQESVADLEIIIFDDASTDGTAQFVNEIAQGDPRVRVITHSSEEPPDGWLGKPWACQQLGEAATGDILMFLDADVVLQPWAIAGAASLLRTSGASLPFTLAATGCPLRSRACHSAHAQLGLVEFATRLVGDAQPQSLVGGCERTVSRV